MGSTNIKSVLFVSDTGSITQLFLPVANALTCMSPGVETRLLDVSKLGGAQNEVIEADNSLFLQNGFPVKDLGPYIEAGTAGRRQQYVQRLSEVIRRLRPGVVVVPHEFGWAFDAVQVAKEHGVPTYHLHHAPWGPSRFGGDQVLVSARRLDAMVSQVQGFNYVIQRQREILASEMHLLRELVCKGMRFLSRLGAMHFKSQSGEAPLWERPTPGTPFGAGTTQHGVCGPYEFRRMVGMGFDPATIDVVGYARTDNFLASQPKSYQNLCRDYGLYPGVDELALYFWRDIERQPGVYLANHDHKRAFFDTVTILRELCPKMNILLLVHPRDRIDTVESWLRSAGLSFVRVGRAKMNHYSLYKHARLVTGMESSCLVEAMLCRCPVVQLAYVVYELFLPQLIEGGAVIPVKSHLHLREQLERALNDKPYVERIQANQEHVVFDLMYHVDGKCGERAAKGIVNLIEGYKQ